MPHQRNFFLITVTSIFATIFLFAGQHYSFAQGFVKKIDGIGYVVATSKTSDEGYVSVSRIGKWFTHQVINDLVFRKFSKSGQKVWGSSFEISVPDWRRPGSNIRGMTEVNDGYILVGLVADFYDLLSPSGGPLLIKLDTSGRIVWSKYLKGQDHVGLETVTAKPDGTFLATGIVWDNPPNPILIKFDAAGNILWSRRFGQFALGNRFSTAISDDGLVLAINRYNGKDGVIPNGVYLVKVNANGQRVWNRELRIKDFDPGSIRVAFDGGILLLDSERNKFVKLSPNGSFQWAARYSMSLQDGELYLMDAIQTMDGGFALVGWTHHWTDDGDGVLLKTDRDGKLVFQKRLGREKTGEVANTIFSTVDNGYFIIGETAMQAWFQNGIEALGNQVIFRVDSRGEFSGCNYVTSMHSVKQKFISGIKTGGFQLKRPTQISFAVSEPEVRSVKLKESIKTICQ